LEEINLIWLIYEDYFKNKEKVTSLLKELKWYNWVIFLVPLLIALTLFYFSIKETNWGFLIIYMLLALISGGYIGYEIKKVKEANYGTEREIYNRKIQRLKDILKGFDITEKDQIDILVNQISENLTSLKLSEQLSKSVYKLSTIVLLPISMLFLKEFTSKEEYYGVAILIITLILTIVGLWLMIKNILELVLDSQYKNMQELKNSLEDISISLLSNNIEE